MFYFEPIWTNLIWFDPVWTNFIWFEPNNLSDSSWSILIQFELVWSNLNQFEPIWTNLNQFEPIWTTLNQVDLIWSNLNWFEPIWSKLILFEPIWTNFIWFVSNNPRPQLVPTNLKITQLLSTKIFWVYLCFAKMSPIAQSAACYGSNDYGVLSLGDTK